MPYVIDYEIGALLVLITVFVRFLPFRRSVDLSRTLFVWLISVALLDLSADILGTLAIAAIEQLPFALTLGVNLFFYLTQATLPMLMMTFVGYISGAFHRRFRKFLPLYLPFLSALVLIFTNPLHHFLAQIAGAPGSYHYISGVGIPILYGICFYHLLVTGIFAVRFRADMEPHQCTTVLFCCLTVVSGIGLQILLPRYLFTGTAIALSILMMSYTMENPQDLTEPDTGVLNRHAFQRFLRAHTEDASPFYVVGVEVTNLGGVQNDLGVYTIRRLLRQVALFLLGVAGKKDFVFRTAETRFLIVTQEEDTYRAIAKTVAARFGQPFRYDARGAILCATIRYYRQDSYSAPGDVLGLLDTAFREAGNGGAGTAEEIDCDCLSRGKRRMAIEESVRMALHGNGGFSLRFQPVFDVARNRFTRAEVLLRLSDPVLGEISPSEFIPIATENGLIQQLDTAVIRMSCDFLRRHPESEEKGLERLGINLSAFDCFLPMRYTINRTVSEFGLSPRRFLFEITETAALINYTEVKALMEGLTFDGYTLSLDDFGTGYSSIMEMKSLPFYSVKLDRSLVSAEDKKGLIIFLDMLSMLVKLGFKAVAEGVETKEQTARALLLGADYLQGYYLSKPLTESEFLKFLDRQEEIRDERLGDLLSCS